MDGFVQVKSIMDEYALLLDKLNEFENEKLEAVKTRDLEKIDQFLNDEQAYLLQLKGLDVKREKVQKEQGFEGLTYREIIGQSPEEMRAELEVSYDLMACKVDLFKELIKTINSYIDVQLHTIDAFMERIGRAPTEKPESGIYDKISKGQERPAGSGFKSTKA